MSLLTTEPVIRCLADVVAEYVPSVISPEVEGLEFVKKTKTQTQTKVNANQTANREVWKEEEQEAVKQTKKDNNSSSNSN